MTSVQRSCVAAGHICLDVIPDLGNQRDFLSSLHPGHLLAVGPPTLAPGGSVSNTGLALHKLGIPTRLMGKTGADPFGRELRDLLHGIDPELAHNMEATPGEHTSYSVILSPIDSDRVFLHSSGANDTFHAGDVDYGLVAKADLFHFGYPTLMAGLMADNGRELTELLSRARSTGATISVDMSMFDRRGPGGAVDWPYLLAQTLPYVDVFLPSLDEVLLMLYPERDAEHITNAEIGELALELLEYGAGIVVLKLGARGLMLRSATAERVDDLGRAFADAAGTWAERELWAPSFQVDVVGTTGAGDCAVAGFLAGILRSETVERALLMAAAVGACNVEAADAFAGVRSWPETAVRVDGGWPQHAITLPTWVYNSTARLWHGPHDPV